MAGQRLQGGGQPSSHSQSCSEEDYSGTSLELEEDEEDEESDEYEEDSDEDQEDEVVNKKVDAALKAQSAVVDNDSDSDGAEDMAVAATHEEGIYDSRHVNDQIFEELCLQPETVQDVQDAWQAFLHASSTPEGVGEALYKAIFDAGPSLQALFKTPRAVMAVRLVNGLSQTIRSLQSPAELKGVVEMLGFQHMDVEVTIPRIAIFRDAIVDLIASEVGRLYTERAHEGLLTLLNYMGGSFIYIRTTFAERLKLLATSWATANSGHGVEQDTEESTHDSTEKDGKKGTGGIKGMGLPTSSKHRKSSRDKDHQDSATAEDLINGEVSVPTNFKEMFEFNAAVMGFSGRPWMDEILASFDTLVRSASSSARMKEECDVISLRIAKTRSGKNINLKEFKSVMLSSLRSLVPRDWNTSHEVAWTWFWDSVEAKIKHNLGKPAQQELALGKLLFGMSAKMKAALCKEIYVELFQSAPDAQDYLKQSTTRLHFIAELALRATLRLYQEPVQSVEEISALGLRHVGYGIPPELFSPFVSAYVQSMRKYCTQPAQEEAFRWSISLIARMLARVVSEGSTLVMTAINRNNAVAVKKAVGCAPRGVRISWMLNVQVGTQAISPLLWSITSGSREAAKTILVDLLTMRADRNQYYYGMDPLFKRHPDIVKRLISDAPDLIWTLLDGLIWRSRSAENGLRRVIYYIKHLVVNPEGGRANAIDWLVEYGDPKIMCHPVAAVVTDIFWSRLAFRAFLMHKAWSIVNLVAFVLSFSIFSGDSEDEAKRITVFACRLFVYLFSLCPLLYKHAWQACQDYKLNRTMGVWRISMPKYLTRWQEVVGLVLVLSLVAMLVTEPILTCLQDFEGDFTGAGLFTQACPDGVGKAGVYRVFGLFATASYFLLLIDLSVFSTRVSAFVLIGCQILREVWLYILATAFVIAMFSCCIANLGQQDYSRDGFLTVPEAMRSLMKIVLNMFEQDDIEALVSEPALLATVVVFIVISVTFLFNLLIAQMSCAYKKVYKDMLGYARLNRGKVVTESMSWVPKWRWERFVASLRFDEPCPFSDSDNGMPGGIQVMELASETITEVDMVQRFGGTTSPDAPWPAEDVEQTGFNSRVDKMERMLEKAIKRMSSTGMHRGHRVAGSARSSSKGTVGASDWGSEPRAASPTTGAQPRAASPTTGARAAAAGC